ncbi:MAG: hypothetical protein CMF39_01495 [Legionellaceae bacterium]|nr:hypothetical protein [Legionellaceae bacterium]
MRQLIQALRKAPAKRAVTRRFSSQGASETNGVKKIAADSTPVTRAEMAAEFKAVRSEMAGEFKAVRAEMAGEFKAVRAEIETVRTEMKSGFETINTKFETINTKFETINTKMDIYNRHINRMATGAGATFLAVMGTFGIYTLGNAKDVGRLEGELKSLQSGSNNTAHHHTPVATPTAPGKR